MEYSALMSVYKKENPLLFKKALLSIFDQTISPTQVVLIEDGKLTEDLLEVIKKAKVAFEKVGIQFLIIMNEKNLGLGVSLKKGVEKCKCKWIARFDSDDVSVNYRMEESIKFLKKNPKVKLLGSYVAETQRNYKDIVSIRKVPEKDNVIKKTVSKRNPFNHMTVFFEKESIIKAGNYKDIPYFEDYYLWLRVLRSGIKTGNITAVLVKANVDKDFLNKRGGLQYLKKEYNFQRLIYEEGYIDFSVFVLNVITRGLTRLLPKRVLKCVYSIIRR